jgi:hypothetical protein
MTIARVLALVAVMFSSAAHAQLFRAYLASDGNDANPCTLAQPCRLLPAALNAVVSGGEIWMLDSANYNTTTVNIAKSVSILSVPGAAGSLVLNAATAIAVSTPDLRVALRNVNVVPIAGTGGPGAYGLHITADSMVTLDNCVFAGLPDDAIRVIGGTLKVVDSVVRDSIAGWAFNVSGDGSNASISGTRILNNGDGGVRASAVSGTAVVTVSDSVVSGGNWGLLSSSSGVSGVTRLTAVRTRVDKTSVALDVRSSGPNMGSPTLVVSDSAVVENGTAWQVSANGAVLYSLGNNMVYGNGGASGSVTLLPPF